jgi:glycosyltransferase involved in cell wall biosynthesis
MVMARGTIPIERTTAHEQPFWAAASPPDTPKRRPLQVIAFASYPIEAAATRYRLCQFIEPLADRGIAIRVRPYLSGPDFRALYERRHGARTALSLIKATANRARDVGRARSADVVFIQREAMLLGPPACELALKHLFRKPLVLDLDDATYVPYTSPTFGSLSAPLKCFGKTDTLIRSSSIVICGNRSIADHVRALGGEPVILPTIVDGARFLPRAIPRGDGPPVIGWVGSHSTFPYLESIFPALERLAQSFAFRLLIVGSGRHDVALPGVHIECRPWRLDREISDFQEIDIGLYPIVPSAWALGKSGFKAIQYMAVGVPFVASPVGCCAEIGNAGETHLLASTIDDWHSALASLLNDRTRRMLMGAAGRRHALEHYDFSTHSDALANVLRRVAESETH